MNEEIFVSAEELRTPAWNDAVRRAERGETVAVIAHGEHVADVVPAGELDRLRETIEVLSDPAARAALADTEPIVFGSDAVRALIADRITRESGDRTAV